MVRTVDTPEGPVLVGIQRIARRYDTDKLTPQELRKVARVLLREATMMEMTERNAGENEQK